MSKHKFPVIRLLAIFLIIKDNEKNLTKDLAKKLQDAIFSYQSPATQHKASL